MCDVRNLGFYVSVFFTRMADGSLADKLCSASARGNLPEVLFLLQNGADVNGFNTYERTALQLPLTLFSFSLLILLTPFCAQVVMLGSTAVIEALLAAGADPNVRDPTCGLTVMHDAAREGFVESVRVLVDHGADANLTDKKGNLPLHLAAKGGYLDVIQLLIGSTADPQTTNDQGYTAAQLALQHHWMDAAKYIEEYLSSRE
ncbi:hypothetical protein L3Q82_025765 [Scortum barcoo]|uniref:Uncharacterized protein n=1 Tax=Scortum barcoo TaxID=214431 RepID=A0ACB8WL35_9TELE|nr:hypothetical protein L3Q82_025765 [Scortum barcoo]